MRPKERIVIAGGPDTGKTTLAAKMDESSSLNTTDAFQGLPWDEVKVKVAKLFDRPGPWIVEGVQTARGLRHWLRTHKTGKPCDRVVWMRGAKTTQTKRQNAMRLGIDTIMGEIVPKLRKRGVRVETKEKRQ